MVRVVPFVALLAFLCGTNGHGGKNNSHCFDPMIVVRNLTQPAKYEKSIRPCENEDPLVVRYAIYIVSINNIKESDMEYDIQFYFRQYWKDHRLSFSHLNTLPYFVLSSGYMRENIWYPDPYFENEKEGKYHDIMKKNDLARLYADGSMFYSSRLTLTLSCPMDFYDFPMDKQVCGIKFMSYAYTTDEVIYSWETNKTETSVFSNDLKLPQFTIVKTEIESQIVNYDKIGDFTVLQVKIHFQRRLAYYLIRNYIPAAFLVAVSSLSFWLDRECAPARVGVGITTILTMTTLMMGMGQSHLPVVSYVKAMDWYNFGCFAFVFLSLLEYAIVNYLDVRQRTYVQELRRREKKKMKSLSAKEETHTNETLKNFGSVFGMDTVGVDHSPTEEIRDEDTIIQSELSDAIDNLVRKIHPLLFLLFNIIYWARYLNHFYSYHM